MRPICSSRSPFLSVRMRSTLLIFFVLTIAVVGASAQIDRAVLEGSVMDATGAVIRGASVRLLAVDTGIIQEQQTNSSGYYRFPGAAVGRYTVTATKPGFTTKVIDEVALQVGQRRTLNITLVVGALAEKMEVKESAGPSDRSSPEASMVINTQQIANLPNNGRDWASFTLLAPFAQDDGGGDQRTIRFAGRARDDNNFQFDGVDAGGFKNKPRNRKPVFRYHRMQLLNTGSAAHCTTWNTERRRAAR